MMTVYISNDVNNYLRRHPILATSIFLLLALILFLAVDLLVRFLIMDVGLYFWFSYIALGVLLGAGSLYLGLSWRKITAGNIHYQPKKLAILASLPAFLVLIDIILRYIIARITGLVSITFAGITNNIMWIIPPNGDPHFQTQRIIQTDNLWLYATLLGMVLLFFVGILASIGTHPVRGSSG